MNWQWIQDTLTQQLEPFAAYFRALDLPEPVTHWGHPLMMGIVLVGMGSAVALTGWKGRLLSSTDSDGSVENRQKHRKIAPWMFLFLVMGYSGGLLSIVIQGHPVLESPHFWTGSVVVGLLGLNAAISLSKFAGGKPALRTVHAYLGSAALGLAVIHIALGLKLGLSF